MSRDKINVERASARACSVGTKGHRRWVRDVSGEMTSTVVWKLGQYEPFRLKVIMKIKVQINRFVIDQRLCGESRSEQLHCISLTLSSGNIYWMWMSAPAFISALEHTRLLAFQLSHFCTALHHHHRQNSLGHDSSCFPQHVGIMGQSQIRVET